MATIQQSHSGPQIHPQPAATPYTALPTRFKLILLGCCFPLAALTAATSVTPVGIALRKETQSD